MGRSKKCTFSIIGMHFIHKGRIKWRYKGTNWREREIRKSLQIETASFNDRLEIRSYQITFSDRPWEGVDLDFEENHKQIFAHLNINKHTISPLILHILEDTNRYIKRKERNEDFCVTLAFHVLNSFIDDLLIWLY